MKSVIPARPLLRFCACVALTAYILTSTGCSPYRTWTTFTYRKLGRATRIIKLTDKTHSYKLVTESGQYYLQLTAKTRCRRVTEDRVRETAHHKVKAPASTYYIILGSVVAVIATPFYIIGARSDGTKRRNNILLGTFMFLTPGGALAGLGTYLKLQEGARHKDLGVTRRRVSSSSQFDCNVRPVRGKQVSVGTLTGLKRLGKTNNQGRIRLSHLTLKPLVRYKFSRVQKIYLDIYLEGENLGELIVPWGKPQPEKPAVRRRPGRKRPKPRTLRKKGG